MLRYLLASRQGQDLGAKKKPGWLARFRERREMRLHRAARWPWSFPAMLPVIPSPAKVFRRSEDTDVFLRCILSASGTL